MKRENGENIEIETDDQELEARSRDALAPLRAQMIAAPPYLKTRVLAHLRDQDRKNDQALGWRRFFAGALAGGAICSIVAVLVVSNMETRGTRTPVLSAVAGVPMAVTLELNPGAQEEDIFYAAVELSEGVSFFSQRFPEIAEKRSLMFHVEGPVEGKGVTSLPIVVRSEQEGVKEVKLRYFNRENRLLGERSVRIRFQEASERG